MGFWDFLVPAELPYPGMPVRSGTTQTGQPAGSASGQPAKAGGSGTGVLDKIFVPAELPYPQPLGFGSSQQLPPTGLTGATLPQGAQAMVCVPAQQQQQQAVSPTPVIAPTIIVQPSSPTATGSTSASPAAAPVVSTPTAPSASAPAASAPPTAAVLAPAASAATPLPTAVPVAGPSPVTVVIAPWPMSGSAVPAPAASDPPAASATPAPATSAATSATQPSVPASSSLAPAALAPIAPVVPLPVVPLPAPVQPVAEAVMMPTLDCMEKRLTAYSRNPRLRARPPKAHELYIEDVLEEVITTRMLSKDAAPVAFAVPDGCNAVEISIGPIEIDPEHGSADDLDEVVTIGELKIEGVDDNGMAPGDQVIVTAPWRHASFVELAADHLRFPIFARFFHAPLTQ